MKRTLLISALALATLGHLPFAQAAAPEEDKAPLVQRAIALWHIENGAIIEVQKPAVSAMTQAKIAITSRMPEAKQDATMKAVLKEVQKYIDEATPIVKANAERLKGPTLTPLFMQKFSAEELRQLIAYFESPIKKKFESLTPEFEKAFGEKMVQASGPAVNVKLQALQSSVSNIVSAAAAAP